MKLLTLFIEKTEFLGLAIQELLSLCRICEIPTDNLFPSEPQLTKDRYPYLAPSDFATFPYVYINVPEDCKPKLQDLLQRAISIERFATVIAEGCSKTAFMENIKANYSLLETEIEDLSTYSFDVKTYLKKYSQTEKEGLIADIDAPFFKAKCDLKNPQRVFYMIENHSPETGLKMKYLAKDIFATRRHKPFATRFRLSDRIFLGPTSTDAELSFLMCNQGLVSKGKWVYDPFFGTGSIMVAASHFEAFCVGCDIDIRVLLGYSVGKLNKNSTFLQQLKPEDKANVFLNFKQYGLALPEILRTDSGSLNFLYDNLFDAIVCDPPYGIRAAPRQQGQRDGKGNELKVGDEDYCIPTKKATCYEVTDRLFELGLRNLKKGGRLVFLFPVLLDADPLEHFKNVEGFTLVAVSKNRLHNKTYARYLFTFEKA